MAGSSMCSKLAPERNLTRPRRRPGLFSSAAALACVALLGVAPARAESVKFCVDKANPMYSTDEAVAAAASRAAGVTPVLVVRDSAVDAISDDDDDLTGASQHKFLVKLAAQCDVIMGFPVEAGFEGLPDGMEASPPYARTGFVAASQGAIAPGGAGLTHTGQVGVLVMTPAMTYFDESTMAHEHVYYSNEDLYGALMHGEINAAFIWQPWLNQKMLTQKQSLHVAAVSLPHANWNIVALYPQTAQNSAAVRQFDSAVTALAASGRLGGIVQPYTVPKTE